MNVLGGGLDGQRCKGKRDRQRGVIPDRPGRERTLIRGCASLIQTVLSTSRAISRSSGRDSNWTSRPYRAAPASGDGLDRAG